MWVKVYLTLDMPFRTCLLDSLNRVNKISRINKFRLILGRVDCNLISCDIGVLAYGTA
jgi:hypothetical protein